VQSVSGKTFRAVRRTRVSGEIIDQVRDLLTSGRLKPGDRLPSERELAQAVSAGRSAVREAIRAMESLGIVEVRAGEGTFVATPDGNQRSDRIISPLFQAWSEQHKLFEVRLVIEPDLAALAARRATVEQIERLNGLLVEQEAVLRLGESGMEQDGTFHFLIAEATGNEVLVRIMESLMDLLQRTREVSLQHPDRPKRSLRQHRAIVRAIEGRNSAAAERHMREHIQEIEELVFATQVRPSAETASSRPSLDPGVAP
jgi:GntR family transcriptional repressor for pyruvate dehydrogenase complex